MTSMEFQGKEFQGYIYIYSVHAIMHTVYVQTL